MESKNILAIAIAITIGILFAMALLPQIANNVTGVTSKVTSTNETVSLSTVRLASTGCINTTKGATALKGNPVTQGFTSSNECKNTGTPVITDSEGTALTLTTDYTYNAATGVITFKNTSAVAGASCDGSNTTYAIYSYCPTGYAADNSGSRAILALVVIFACIGVVVFAAWPSMGETLRGAVGI